jgi:hypothetical protein
MISSDSNNENWEVTEAGKLERLGRSRDLRVQGGRKFWEVREVENY